MYLENMNVNSNNISELESVIINLEQFKGRVSELYPNIVTQCLVTLENKIVLANSNINTLKALEAKREAESKTKQAEAKVEEMHDADDEIIKEIENIDSGLTVISGDKDMLNEKLLRLRELFKSMKYTTTQTLAGEVAEKIKVMIGEIKDDADVAIVKETFTVEGTVDDMKALVRFMRYVLVLSRIGSGYTCLKSDGKF